MNGQDLRACDTTQVYSNTGGTGLDEQLHTGQNTKDERAWQSCSAASRSRRKEIAQIRHDAPPQHLRWPQDYVAHINHFIAQAWLGRMEFDGPAAHLLLHNHLRSRSTR